MEAVKLGGTGMGPSTWRPHGRPGLRVGAFVLLLTLVHPGCARAATRANSSNVNGTFETAANWAPQATPAGPAANTTAGNATATTSATQSTTPAPPGGSAVPVETTPADTGAGTNETNNITIIENLTVVNITQVDTQYVVTSGGLDAELGRVVSAFRNPRQFFQAADLDQDAVTTLWVTCVFFIFFSMGIAVDRSRYKPKGQNNHNLLLLISLVTCLNYLSMANGHGRALVPVIKDIRPFNLTRICIQVNKSSLSSPAASASSRRAANMPQALDSLLSEDEAWGEDGGSGGRRTAAGGGGGEDDKCEDGNVVYRFMSADATAEMVPLDPPFFYSKYLQWLVTTNVMLYLLCRSVAHATRRVTLLAMAFNSMMIFCGLCAAALRTENIEDSQVPRYITSKWVYWVFGMVFYIMLLSVLNRHVTRAAHHHRTRPELANAFNVLFYSLCVIWSLYPFAWVWLEFAMDINEDVPVTRLEAWAYSFLDIAGKLVFTVLFLLRVPPKRHLVKSNSVRLHSQDPAVPDTHNQIPNLKPLTVLGSCWCMRSMIALACVCAVRVRVRVRVRTSLHFSALCACLLYASACAFELERRRPLLVACTVRNTPGDLSEGLATCVVPCAGMAMENVRALLEKARRYRRSGFKHSTSQNRQVCVAIVPPNAGTVGLYSSV